jgi:hypothetical protein
VTQPCRAERKKAVINLFTRGPRGDTPLISLFIPRTQRFNGTDVHGAGEGSLGLSLDDPPSACLEINITRPTSPWSASHRPFILHQHHPPNLPRLCPNGTSIPPTHSTWPCWNYAIRWTNLQQPHVVLHCMAESETSFYFRTILAVETIHQTNPRRRHGHTVSQTILPKLHLPIWSRMENDAAHHTSFCQTLDTNT